MLNQPKSYLKSLTNLYPSLAEQWHPTKNDRTPSDVSAGSQFIAWWLCNCGNEWQAEVRARVGRGTRKPKDCPNCAKLPFEQCLASTHPQLLPEWHPTLNTFTPYDVTFGRNEVTWWKCAKNPNHIWDMRISQRTSAREQGCPFCAGKRVCRDDSLAVVNPELASELHPTKNGNLTADKLLPGSQQQVWWQCKINLQHIWLTRVANRHINKSRCRYCFGNVKGSVDTSRTFAHKCSDLIPEWHPIRNGELTPYNVFYGSQQEAWWKCSEKGHEWSATILSRSSGSGCPYCSGHEASPENNIAVTHPDELEFWDYDKNEIQPHEVSHGSKKIIWWKCDFGEPHTYKAAACDRIGNTNKKAVSCTECRRPPVSDAEIRLSAELNYIFPISFIQPFYEISAEHLNIFKPKTPDIVSSSAKLIIEVDGSNWHTDEKDIQRNEYFNRLGYKVLCLRGKKNLTRLSEHDVLFNCKKITIDDVKRILVSISQILGNNISNEHKEIINSYMHSTIFMNDELYNRRKRYIGSTIKRINFLTYHPDIAKEWHPTKNDRQPDTYTPCSAEVAWWLCENEHEWQEKISRRVYGKKCVTCKSIAYLYPDIAAELHPTRNKDISPNTIAAGSNKIYWWLCKSNHPWQTTPNRRIRENARCQFCQGRKPCTDNCLAKTNQKVAAEWHPTRNENLVNKKGEPITPYNVTAGQKLMVWWLCSNNQLHEWQATIDSRNRGNGCKFCSGRSVHITNCLATINPQLAKEWHPTRNVNLTPYHFTPGSKHKAWWLCKCRYEYQSIILSRSHGHGCPDCANKIKSVTAKKRWQIYNINKMSKAYDT